MSKQNYEQTRFSGRLREYGILYFFILFAGIISLILMNLLVFPIAVTAVKAPALFTSIVKYGLLALIALWIVSRIVRSILRLIRTKDGILSSVKSSLKRRFLSFSFGFIVAVSTAALFLVIVFLLKYNYFYLYEILN